MLKYMKKETFLSMYSLKKFQLTIHLDLTNVPFTMKILFYFA